MYKRQMLYFLILVKKAKKHILLSILLIRLITPSYGQGTFEESPFVNMIFKIDTSVYTWEENAMMINGEMQLPFYYDSENEMAEVEMKLAEHADAAAIQLKFSNDYILVDSLLNINDHIRFKVKFKDLTSSNFLVI
mgnify:FL=1